MVFCVYSYIFYFDIYNLYMASPFPSLQIIHNHCYRFAALTLPLPIQSGLPCPFPFAFPPTLPVPFTPLVSPIQPPLPRTPTPPLPLSPINLPASLIAFISFNSFFSLLSARREARFADMRTRFGLSVGLESGFGFDWGVLVLEEPPRWGD